MPSKFRVVAALAFLGTASAAHAQGYPAHAVSLVVPYAAGGPTDTIARIIAARMSPALGQTVVVENTTGAGGSIGVGKVARAARESRPIRQSYAQSAALAVTLPWTLAPEDLFARETLESFKV